MTTTAEELIQKLKEAFLQLSNEQDDVIRSRIEVRLTILTGEVKRLDQHNLTRFKGWLRMNPYKGHSEVFDAMWREYQEESKQARRLREAIEKANSASSMSPPSAVQIGRHILSSQEMNDTINQSQQYMASQGPGTSQGAHYGPYGHHGSGTPQGPPMGPYGQQGSGTAQGPPMGPYGPYGYHTRGPVDWHVPSPSTSQGHTMGQNNQYSGQNYQSPGSNSLPLPPRRRHNPVQYPSGQPQAGPSQQQIGHSRMFSGSTFGNPRSSGESNQNQSNQSDPRSSGESSGSGTSYHTAREFQPMYPDGSSSGGGYGYGHY